MKRLLTLLSAIMFVTTPSFSIVSCSIGSKQEVENINYVLKQNNYNLGHIVTTEFDKPTEDNPILLSGVLNKAGIKAPSDLFFNNGIEMKNLVGSNLIAGTYNSDANDHNIINELNDKLNLNMQLDIPQTYDDLSSISTYGDAKNLVLSSINQDKKNLQSLDALNEVQIVNVEGSYKKAGESDPEVKNSDDGYKTLDKILFNNGSIYDRTKSNNYQSGLEAGSFVKKITFKNPKNNLTWTVSQILQVINPDVFLTAWDGFTDSDIQNSKGNIKPSKKDNYLANIQTDYGFLDKDYSPAWNGQKPTEAIANFIKSKIDLFALGSQDYYVSVSIDGNDIVSRVKELYEKEVPKFVNDTINKYNQQQLINGIKNIPTNNDVPNQPTIKTDISSIFTKTDLGQIKETETLTEQDIFDALKKANSTTDSSDSDETKVESPLDSFTYDNFNYLVQPIDKPVTPSKNKGDDSPTKPTPNSETKYKVYVTAKQDLKGYSGTVLANFSSTATVPNTLEYVDISDKEFWKDFTQFPRYGESITAFQDTLTDYVNLKIKNLYGIISTPPLSFNYGDLIIQGQSTPTITSTTTSISVKASKNNFRKENDILLDGSVYVFDNFDKNTLSQSVNDRDFDTSIADQTLENAVITTLKNADWLYNNIWLNKKADLNDVFSKVYFDTKQSNKTIVNSATYYDKKITKSDDKKAIILKIANNIKNINYASSTKDIEASGLIDMNTYGTTYKLSFTDSNYKETIITSFTFLDSQKG